MLEVQQGVLFPGLPPASSPSQRKLNESRAVLESNVDRVDNHLVWNPRQ